MTTFALNAAQQKTFDTGAAKYAAPAKTTVAAPAKTSGGSSGKSSGGSSSAIASTAAAFNPNTGAPLKVGETAIKDGVTYTGTTSPITSSDGKSPLDLTNSIQNSLTSPTATPASLKVGSSGTEVSGVQKALGVTADGKYGPQTEAAVVAFQKANGLTADGIVGPQTLAALNKKSGTQTDDTTKTDSGKTPVQTSDQARAAEIKRIKDELNSGAQAPAPYSSLAEFDKMRADKGVVQDEAELASIRNEAAMAKEQLNQFKQTSSAGMSEGGYLGGISEAERNMNFRLDSLSLREAAVTDRLNTKNSYINTALNLGKEDYQTAYTNYTNEYNKNLKAVEMYNTEMNDQQKDALTGFTTITNLLKDKNIANIDPALSTQLDSMALKAGLPAGTFQAVMKATPDEKILSPVIVDTAKGKDVYFYTQDKNGVPSLKTVQHLSDDKGGSSGVVKFTPEDKQRLVVSGFNSTDITNIERDINAHGFDKTTEGMSEKQKTSIKNVLSGITPTQEQKQASDNPTIDEFKVKFKTAAESRKNLGYTRDEFEKELEKEYGDNIPGAIKQAIEDVGTEVFGRTFLEKVLPGGR